MSHLALPLGGVSGVPTLFDERRKFVPPVNKLSLFFEGHLKLMPCIIQYLWLVFCFRRYQVTYPGMCCFFALRCSKCDFDSCPRCGAWDQTQANRARIWTSFGLKSRVCDKIYALPTLFLRTDLDYLLCAQVIYFKILRQK